MNKYIIAIIVIVILIAGFFYWQSRQSAGNDNQPNSSTDTGSDEVGTIKEFTIRTVEGKWQFDPGVINVQKGDRVEITLVNEDDFDHGFGIEKFGINERMPAKSTVKISFDATETGEFPFFCSVPCGSGEVLGEKRDHFDMMGTVVVQGAA